MVRVGRAGRGLAHDAVRAAVCALTAFALIACEPGAGGKASEQLPPLVRFAIAGNPCDSTATVYIDSADGAPLYCGADEDNYTGPLFPSEIDEATLGTEGFQVHWTSDIDRERWERAVEDAFERIAAPRLARRQACTGDIGEVHLTVSLAPDSTTRPYTIVVLVTLDPAPGTVTLTWELSWHHNDAVVEGGFTARDLKMVALSVPAEGSASTSAQFVLRDGGKDRYTNVQVWINAESECGAIDTAHLLAF